MNWADFKIAEKAGMVVNKESLAQVDGTKNLGDESLLAKALTLSRGVHEFRLTNMPTYASELPANPYQYGYATVKVWTQGNTVEVILWGHKHDKAKKIAKNYYADGEWGGWLIEATTADLANYLPLSGGTLTGQLLKFYNGYSAIGTDETHVNVTSYNDKANTATSRRIMISNSKGVSDVGKAVVLRDTINGSITDYTLLHTGNYTNYALPKSDPSVTGDLTVSRYNNGFSKFHKSHDNGTVDYGTIIHDETKDGTKVLLIVQANQNGAFFRDTSGTTHTLLHTGNSAKVAIQESAPTDTTALWVY